MIIKQYVPFIQAVMMQGSGGKGNNPMQLFEYPCKKISKKYNSITNTEERILRASVNKGVIACIVS